MCSTAFLDSMETTEVNDCLNSIWYGDCDRIPSLVKSGTSSDLSFCILGGSFHNFFSDRDRIPRFSRRRDISWSPCSVFWAAALTTPSVIRIASDAGSHSTAKKLLTFDGNVPMVSDSGTLPSPLSDTKLSLLPSRSCSPCANRSSNEFILGVIGEALLMNPPFRSSIAARCAMMQDPTPIWQLASLYGPQDYTSFDHVY